jgi:hypothetical protein
MFRERPLICTRKNSSGDLLLDFLAAFCSVGLELFSGDFLSGPFLSEGFSLLSVRVARWGDLELEREELKLREPLLELEREPEREDPALFVAGDRERDLEGDLRWTLFRGMF